MHHGYNNDKDCAIADLHINSSKESTPCIKARGEKRIEPPDEISNLDKDTQNIIDDMIKKKHFSRTNEVVYSGEECIVLHANDDEKELAVKIFKMNSNVYDKCAPKRRKVHVRHAWGKRETIQNDCKRKDKSLNKIIYNVAKNEMNNLKAYKEAGIACPDAVALQRNILVMSFIGEAHKPGTKLRNVSSNDLIDAYPQVINAMKTLYEKSNLIHENFSEDNVLFHDKKCYFISIDRLVKVSEDNAFSCLLYNCKNISKFFKRRISEPIVASGQEIFQDIVGDADKIANCPIDNELP